MKILSEINYEHRKLLRNYMFEVKFMKYNQYVSYKFEC